MKFRDLELNKAFVVRRAHVEKKLGRGHYFLYFIFVKTHNTHACVLGMRQGAPDDAWKSFGEFRFIAHEDSIIPVKSSSSKLKAFKH